METIDLPTAWIHNHKTLIYMRNIRNYSTWIYHTIEPFLGDQILEVGCGIGNMTRYFLERSSIVSIDIQPQFVLSTGLEYASHPNVTVMQGDICSDTTRKVLDQYSFDTVVCINVLEHIQDDSKALQIMHSLLGTDGRVVVHVPAGAYLYGSLDRMLCHYRRYGKDQLRRLMEEHGYIVEQIGYMNVLGILGWYLSSKVLQRQTLSEPALSVYDWFCPVLAWVEKAVKPPIGLSLVCIARKT